MSHVIHVKFNDKRTVDEAIEAAKEHKIEELLLAGIDDTGNIFIYGAGIDNMKAVWLAEHIKIIALED